MLIKRLDIAESSREASAFIPSMKRDRSLTHSLQVQECHSLEPLCPAGSCPYWLWTRAGRQAVNVRPTMGNGAAVLVRCEGCRPLFFLGLFVVVDSQAPLKIVSGCDRAKIKNRPPSLTHPPSHFCRVQSAFLLLWSVCLHVHCKKPIHHPLFSILAFSPHHPSFFIFHLAAFSHSNLARIPNLISQWQLGRCP